MGNRWLLVFALAASVALSGCTTLPGGGKGPGSKYEEYLTGGGVLVVEIDHSPGVRPSSDARAHIRDEVGRISQKTIETPTSQDLPSRGSNHVYTLSQLRALHDQHQDERDRRGVVVMHALYVDGRIETDDGRRVAGVAFDDDAFAIAMGTIRELTCSDSALVCTEGARETTVVQSVSVHEAGHLLGLVNLGLPMVQDHEDPDHPGHSSNDQSVMWWQVEVVRSLANIISGDSRNIPQTFDSADIQDARAIQGGS